MSRPPSPESPSAAALVGPLEYECLTALWQLGSASVGQLRAHLNDRRDDGQLAYTTVMTVLVRLHDKAVLARSKQGRGFVYAPRLAEAELVEQLGRRAVDKLLATFGDVAVAQFACAMRDGGPRRLAALRDLIADGADDDQRDRG